MPTSKGGAGVASALRRRAAASYAAMPVAALLCSA